MAGDSPAGITSNNQGVEGFFNQGKTHGTMRLKANIGLSTQRMVEWMHHVSLSDDTFPDEPDVTNPTWRSAQRLLDLKIGSYTYKVPYHKPGVAHFVQINSFLPATRNDVR